MLDEADKTQIKLAFDNWLEIQDRKSELTKENATIIEGAAGILEVKKPMVTKLFKLLKKKHDDAEDELGELTELMEEAFGDE
jgi:hypothetical protein